MPHPPTDHQAHDQLNRPPQLIVPSLHIAIREHAGFICVDVSGHPDIRTTSAALRTPYSLSNTLLDAWIRAYHRNAAITVAYYKHLDPASSSQGKPSDPHPDDHAVAMINNTPRLPSPLPEQIALHYHAQLAAP